MSHSSGIGIGRVTPWNPKKLLTWQLRDEAGHIPQTFWLIQTNQRGLSGEDLFYLALERGLTESAWVEVVLSFQVSILENPGITSRIKVSLSMHWKNAFLWEHVRNTNGNTR